MKNVKQEIMKLIINHSEADDGTSIILSSFTHSQLLAEDIIKKIDEIGDFDTEKALNQEINVDSLVLELPDSKYQLQSVDNDYLVELQRNPNKKNIVAASFDPTDNVVPVEEPYQVNDVPLPQRSETKIAPPPQTLTRTQQQQKRDDVTPLQKDLTQETPPQQKTDDVTPLQKDLTQETPPQQKTDKNLPRPVDGTSDNMAEMFDDNKKKKNLDTRKKAKEDKEGAFKKFTKPNTRKKTANRR